MEADSCLEDKAIGSNENEFQEVVQFGGARLSLNPDRWKSDNLLSHIRQKVVIQEAIAWLGAQKSPPGF
jgi:hypothetical protein